VKDYGQRRRASSIKVGDVQGTGIVIGNGSSVSVELQQSHVQHDAGVHSRGAVNWYQRMAGSGSSQGFPASASRMASSA
jgi:hypothetical protein